MTTTEHHDLMIERTLDAPRDQVWKARTDPTQLKKWWAPKPYETTDCEVASELGETM
ncbi:SRPBCC domain-containing protein [Sphingosinicella sp. CPCC 101087]|uniref:SRPBCC domain-containing protein n=1 Tax=Sphingosinicella sp. CPCC 101087 TaxID=2497754 RepID=UPI00101C34EB|nr:SRPBCC domain-containing protein [Sphingosinicella sp. CPCC 101087]